MIRKFSIAFLLVIVLGSALLLGYRWYRGSSNSNDYIVRWLRNPARNEQLYTDALVRCGDAPFIIPSSGFIGLLWRDNAAPYNSIRRHTGIDIFGRGASGTVPIYAAYDGWLTRLDNWTSTVIIRHDDPLQTGRTIWTYYTHMASLNGDSYIVDAYPQGTFSVPITQGTLIGYQGLYNPPFPIAMHVHMSIVTSNEDGSFRNEAILENTIDPSPYFGLDVNADTADVPVTCRHD